MISKTEKTELIKNTLGDEPISARDISLRLQKKGIRLSSTQISMHIHYNMNGVSVKTSREKDRERYYRRIGVAALELE